MRLNVTAIDLAILACVLVHSTLADVSSPKAGGSNPHSTPLVPGITDQYGDFRGIFHALTDPSVTTAANFTEIDGDDEVLGITCGGESRAYPLRYIWWHHLINDTIGGKPVLITYCLVCNSGVAYDPVFEGKRHIFDVFGIYRGVAAMYDVDNDTIWSHIAGDALLGPDKGKSLAYLPMVNVTWNEWKRLHPSTTTPKWDDEYRSHYRQAVHSGTALMPFGFTQTMTGLMDKRLGFNTLVLATRVEGKPRVYPYKALADAGGVVEETIGSTPVVCLYTPTPKTGAAYDRRVDGAVLEFAADPSSTSRFLDTGTNSTWTIEGTCIAGPLAGRQLTRVFSLQSQWYGWAAYFPNTTIYGMPDQPTSPSPTLTISSPAEGTAKTGSSTTPSPEQGREGAAATPSTVDTDTNKPAIELSTPPASAPAGADLTASDQPSAPARQ